MTVQQLLDLLDGVNPNYEVKLDINYSLEDSFTTDPVTKVIYLETLPHLSTDSIKPLNLSTECSWTIPEWLKEPKDS